MPRKPRMYMAGAPALVIQRDNNRDASSFHEDHYRFYRQRLAESCATKSLHVYVLMRNHTHLLMSPVREDGISEAMQSLGIASNISTRPIQRSGTLWESRHQTSLVDAENYWLACSRYIKLSLVSGRHGASSCRYPWPSC